MKPLLAGLVFVALAGSALAQVVREKGAVYLEDFLEPGKEVILEVKHPAPVFHRSDGQRRLGTLVVGRPAKIIAATDRAYLVQTKAEHAMVRGWITPKALEVHDGDAFVKTIKELHERQLLVADLIDQGQVALGMTLSEVKQSLGEPDRLQSELDTAGRTDVLEYVTYDRVPQRVNRIDPTGIPYTAIAFVKVETGKVEIELKDEVVTAIRNEKGAPNLNAPVTITPPPVLVF